MRICLGLWMAWDAEQTLSFPTVFSQVPREHLRNWLGRLKKTLRFETWPIARVIFQRPIWQKFVVNFLTHSSKPCTLKRTRFLWLIPLLLLPSSAYLLPAPAAYPRVGVYRSRAVAVPCWRSCSELAPPLLWAHAVRTARCRTDKIACCGRLFRKSH